MATLYERLGGAEGIHEMVDLVISAHLENPVVKERFEAVEDLDHAKKMASEFFGAGSGGPEPYTGKDMRSAHEGMNITEGEYAAVVDDIMRVADKRGLDDETKNDILGIVNSLKPEIVGV